MVLNLIHQRKRRISKHENSQLDVGILWVSYIYMLYIYNMFDHVVDFFGFQGQFTRRCYFLPRFSAEPKNCAELPSSSSTDVAGSKEAWRIVFASEMARNWKSSWRNWLRNWLQLVWISQLSPSGGASEKLRHSRKIVGNLMRQWNWCDCCAMLCHSTFSEMLWAKACAYTCLWRRGRSKTLAVNSASTRKILEDPGRFENAWDKVEMDSTSPCLPHADQVLYDQWFFNASVILMACVTFPTRSVIIFTQFYRFAGLLKGLRTNKLIAWLS